MAETNQPPHYPYPPPPYYQEEDELSLFDLWNIVWKRKWLWLTLGPLAGVIGLIVAITSTEIYRAEVLMAPAQNEESSGGLSALAGQFGGLASMAGISLPSGSDSASAIATLKSRRFINAFVEERNLLPVLFADEWSMENKTWKSQNSEEIPTFWDAYELFSDVLNVSEDKKTGLITLAIEWHDPELTEKWANELSNRINSHLRELAKSEAERNLAYLEEQLKQTQVIEIKQSLFALIESQTRNAMLANAKEEYAFDIIDPAVVPEQRIRPRRTLVVLASGMLGGFLGLLMCFILHFAEIAKTRDHQTEG